KVMFLTGAEVAVPASAEPGADEAKKERERAEKSKRDKSPPPAPKFSLRAQLVELALQPAQREFFARAIVNRIWLRLFGHGLGMRADQMPSENPPSHPELLAWLARDTAEHGYDLKRLVRGLVLSKTYGRSGQWEGDDVPRPNYFAG